ncbi:hypothetical protein [Treponema endosymbiont of Eucomonympha sp.]|uniref:hypothetical protein n=1 Tax=Treponema endosymbiont of Eucomonympha sp. TaxID=1580831 RepID=UPI000B205E59|nr:hypothetical protein [Treponema endosymbiont of Eucomonympha sp.]
MLKIYAAAESACPRSGIKVFGGFLLFLRTKAARPAAPELPKPAAKGIPSGLKGIPYGAKGVPSMLKGTPSGLKKVPLGLKGIPYTP